MKTLTKYDLAKQLAASMVFRRCVLTNRQAIDIVDTVADLIICHFQEGGDQVCIRGFGTLKIKRRKGFTGRDPRNGEPVKIPSRLSASFKPSAEMIVRINHPQRSL